MSPSSNDSVSGAVLKNSMSEELRVRYSVLQGRAGEALSFELAKCLERALNAHPSGRGMASLRVNYLHEGCLSLC